MSREKVAIVLSSESNFDIYAFKYFILSVNKLQKQYEFIFPEVHKTFFSKNHYEKTTLFDKFHQRIRPDLSFEQDPSYYINIVTSSISNNLFFVTRSNISFISTDTWEKVFSPPSVYEYLLHCIIASLIFMHPKFKRHSHRDTRGCYMDYTYFKKDDKVDILLGYLCDECKDEIIKHIGEDFYNDICKIINRDWIGDINTHNTVAYNLKSNFSFDVNKDSGFNKTFFEKAKEHFVEIPKEVIILALGALIGVIITSLFN